MMKQLLLGAAALALFACSPKEPAEEATPAEETTAPAETEAPAAEEAPADEPTMHTAASLDEVLAAQSDETKARYAWRHPKETLEFFGVAPGMTVVDTLPGNPWYTGILIDYLGPDGKVIGADYSAEMWSLFGDYAPPAGSKDNWASEWTAEASAWRDEADDAQIGAVAFGHVPDEMAGTVDVVLQVRSLHHFNRFEDEGGHMTQALADMMKMLKPGGVVGVVQHRAPAGNSDAWASGDNGYLKQDQVIAAFEAAGFELVSTSEINANANDKPTEQEFVWRLPPTLATSADNADLKAQMEAIGESDRMTLLFRKPA